ncbi:MAG TPA: flap endonuclease-1 [Thermoplasmata archaeon]|nr:flap endonuclease-1 [Thermoplasmata archaeon]
MGVNLSDLVPATPRRLEDFAGRAIAIDAFNTLYQFLSIIRQPDGTPLMDRQGRVTSHLSGIIYRTTNLLAVGIRPIFVFDGEPPKLKGRTIEARGDVKRKAEAQWQDAILKGDLATARTKAMQTSRLTGAMVEQSERLLRLLGVPCVHAPGEGEAQAAQMANKGDAWAAASQDYDSFLFGAPILVRNLALSGRRKLPRKDVYVEVPPEQAELETTLRALGLTREQLVDLAILIGTDFNEGIKGIGPKKARALITKHGTLEAALHTTSATIEHANEIRDIFLRPNVTDAYELAWTDPDPEGVKRMLVDEHDFTEERIESALAKVLEARKKAGQRALDQFL